MKKKIVLIIFITIISLQFSACEKPAKDHDYSKILNGDLSDFAGVWVNGFNQRAHLRPDGTFTLSMDNGVFWEGQNILGFSTGKNSVWRVTASGHDYLWGVEPSPGFGGYGVALIPTGIDFSFNNHKFSTDKTKVRIVTVPDLNVYYLEEDNPLTLYYRSREAASDITENSLSLQEIIIRRATDDILESFNSYFEFNDTNRGGEKIVISANFTLNNFDFLAIKYDYGQDAFVVEKVLTSINVLTSERAFLINNSNTGGDVPIRGITFVNGSEKNYFYIKESESAGAFSLQQFYPSPVINDNSLNNTTSLFAYIINNEYIYGQIFENDEPLLNNRTVMEYTDDNLQVSSDNAGIIVHIWGGIYQIYKIIINPNSEYLSKFPYKHMNDYLSVRNFGEIEEYSSNHIRYSFIHFNTDTYNWYFSLTLYFNADGALLSAEFGFPMG